MYYRLYTQLLSKCSCLCSAGLFLIDADFRQKRGKQESSLSLRAQTDSVTHSFLISLCGEVGIFIVIAYLFGRGEESEEKKEGNVDRAMQAWLIICEQRMSDIKPGYKSSKKRFLRTDSGRRNKPPLSQSIMQADSQLR